MGKGRLKVFQSDVAGSYYLHDEEEGKKKELDLWRIARLSNQSLGCMQPAWLQRNLTRGMAQSDMQKWFTVALGYGASRRNCLLSRYSCQRAQSEPL